MTHIFVLADDSATLPVGLCVISNDVDLLPRVHLDIKDFLQLVVDKGDQVLAVGVFLFNQEEAALIHAVAVSIRRHCCADDRVKGREEILHRDHLIVFLWLGFSRPVQRPG